VSAPRYNELMHSMHLVIRSLIAVMTVLALQGCGEKTRSDPSASADPPSSSQPDAAEDELMRAVFGERFDPKLRVAVSTLGDAAQSERYAINAVSHHALPTGEMLLVANADQADESGEAMGTHAASGLLNVYVLRKENGQWRVIKRHEAVDELGSSGNIGTAQWVALGRGRTGLAMLHGGTWQGATMTLLSLYDVTAGDVLSLTREPINIHSDSGECRDQQECWDITGNWKFAPAGTAGGNSAFDDLVIEFSGQRQVVPPGESQKEGKKTTMDSVRGKARYRFDGMQFTLVEGKNLVPGL
jgi:predicted small lipoprotein YifL